MEKSKETKFELRDVESLIPYARNARTHSAEQVNRIAGSIKEFGFMNPVIVSEDGGILAGHGRVMAAQKLGLRKVPCVVESHLSETQRKAYILADNKLALDAGWDEEMLKVELNELREDEFDLGMIGFSDEEIEQYLRAENGMGEMPTNKEDGEEEEIEVGDGDDSVTQKGDVWIMGEHRLICGDSTDAETVKKVMGGIKPKMMVTDPPYGTNYDPKTSLVHYSEGRKGKVFNDDRVDWTESYALFPGEIAYVWHNAMTTGTVMDNLKTCGFTINSVIIWNKDIMGGGFSDYRWKHETCVYATKGNHNWKGGRGENTVWDIPCIRSLTKTEGAWGHGTQKPIECMKRPILNNSDEGDVIYDPFCGSGTTIIACEKTKRKCVGIELSENYCDAIVRRWEKESGLKAYLEDGGQFFDDLAESDEDSESEE